MPALLRPEEGEGAVGVRLAGPVARTAVLVQRLLQLLDRLARTVLQDVRLGPDAVPDGLCLAIAGPARGGERVVAHGLQILPVALPVQERPQCPAQLPGLRVEPGRG